MQFLAVYFGSGAACEWAYTDVDHLTWIERFLGRLLDGIHGAPVVSRCRLRIVGQPQHGHFGTGIIDYFNINRTGLVL